MPVTWTQDLATGVRDIDEQHRDLFTNVAALRDSMRLGDVRAATRTLTFLDRYTRDHFATEERWMSASSYPGLAAHRAAHEDFLREFQSRKERLERTGPTASLVLDVSEWLGTWLSDHVRRVDRAMGEWLRDRTPPATSSGAASGGVRAT